MSPFHVSLFATSKSTSKRGRDPFASPVTGHQGKEQGAHQERWRDSGVSSLRRRGEGGDQLLQLAEGSLWSKWSQTCGRCTRAGQKLEHRKLQLSGRHVYFKMTVEQVVRGVVETLFFKIFKTWQVSLVASHLCCSCVRDPLLLCRSCWRLFLCQSCFFFHLVTFVILFISCSSGGKIAAQYLRTSY